MLISPLKNKFSCSNPKTDGSVWKCGIPPIIAKWCTPKKPMVLLIIIPTLDGYFIGGIPHFQTYPDGRLWHPQNNVDIIYDHLSSPHTFQHLLETMVFCCGITLRSGRIHMGCSIFTMGLGTSSSQSSQIIVNHYSSPWLIIKLPLLIIQKKQKRSKHTIYNPHYRWAL